MKLNVQVRKDNVISVIDPETMSVEITHQIFDIVEGQARELRKRRERVRILVDARQVKQDGEEVRRVVFQRGKVLDFDRLAILGANSLHAKSINMLLLAALVFRLDTSIEKIKFFKDEQSALAWLKSNGASPKD